MLSNVIYDNQFAFIPSHLISDNIMVAHEICHFQKWKAKGPVGFLGLKIYMAKAYDRVEWEFSQFMMKALSFADYLIGLVMMFLSSVEYRILVNY